MHGFQVIGRLTHERINIRTKGEYLTLFEHPMDFIIIVYSMLYRSLFLINVHTLCHLIISDWKNTICTTYVKSP